MMTRDEDRAKCIEEMERAWMAHYGIDQGQFPFALRAMTAAFDSLHSIAVVCPVEITEEMFNSIKKSASKEETFRAMSAAGDLTNGPEEK
jgi:hypothetical protein